MTVIGPVVDGVVECGAVAYVCRCGLPPGHDGPHECLRTSDETTHPDGRCHGRWTMSDDGVWLTMWAPPGGLDIPGYPDGVPPGGITQRALPDGLAPGSPLITVRRGGIHYPPPPPRTSYDYLMRPKGLT